MFTGSGHAQSMLVNGQALLSSDGPMPKPRQLGGPWRDPAFPGSVTLWLRFGRDEHLELRWKSGSGSAQIRYAAVRRIHHDLVDTAYELEVKRLEALHGPEALYDETPGRFPTLEDNAGLVQAHADRLATMGMRGTDADWGKWRAERASTTPVALRRPAWQRRERRIPLTVVEWCATELLEVIKREEEEREKQPSAD